VALFYGWWEIATASGDFWMWFLNGDFWMVIFEWWFSGDLKFNGWKWRFNGDLVVIFDGGLSRGGNPVQQKWWTQAAKIWGEPGQGGGQWLQGNSHMKKSIAIPKTQQSHRCENWGWFVFTGFTMVCKE
jgi:hypothetical protein